MKQGEVGGFSGVGAGGGPTPHDLVRARNELDPLESPPELHVLNCGEGAKCAADVGDPGALVEALADKPVPPAAPRDNLGKRWREVGDGLAIQPVIVPEEVCLAVAKYLGSRGPEEGLDLGLAGEVQVAPPPQGVSGLEPKPAHAQGNA